MDSPSGPPGGTLDSTVRPRDCIKILVASDNHIGALENDPVRGNDSITTFQEILRLAVENNVDMLLLVGDLFHENKPSRQSLYRTIALLREYCLNDRPVSIDVVSDAGIGVKPDFSFPPVNYEDENVNVGLPVFSIHGNHDDPQGAGPDGALCALDILSATGLINYFGRQDLPIDGINKDGTKDEEGIQVKPILIQKGSTKLALYGIGNIRDERFHAELRSGKINMYRPVDDVEDWFNLLLIHQNRVAHGPQSSVPETGFGDEIDLILWGHEHDCRIEPEPVTGRKYYISQPGSSIATTLTQGESVSKKVGLLKIQDHEFMMESIPLRSVRPFIFDTVVLEHEKETNNVELNSRKSVQEFLRSKVEDLIKRAQDDWIERNGEGIEEEMMLPLIRLRVDYSGEYEIGNPQRFGQEFQGRIANPKDVISLHKRKSAPRKIVRADKPENVDLGNGGVDQEDEAPERQQKIRIETLVNKYLEAQTLQVFAQSGLQRAIENFVEKDDTNALKEFIKEGLEESRLEVQGSYENEDAESEEELVNRINTAREKAEENYKSNSASKKNDAHSENESDFGRMSSEEENGSNNNKSRRNSIMTVTTKSTGKSRTSEALFAEESEDESQETTRGKRSPPRTTKNTSTRGKRAAASIKASESRASTRNSKTYPTTSKAKKKAQSKKVMSEEEDEEDIINILSD